MKRSDFFKLIGGAGVAVIIAPLLIIKQHEFYTVYETTWDLIQSICDRNGFDIHDIIRLELLQRDNKLSVRVDDVREIHPPPKNFNSWRLSQIRFPDDYKYESGNVMEWTSLTSLPSK